MAGTEAWDFRVRRKLILVQPSHFMGEKPASRCGLPVVTRVLVDDSMATLVPFFTPRVSHSHATVLGQEEGFVDDREQVPRTLILT